jgi:hypothetical protein
MYGCHARQTIDETQRIFLMDNKKLTSTIALFLVFIGFLWWGLSMLAAPQKDGETIVYSLLLLACSGYALVSLLMLPRKKLP